MERDVTTWVEQLRSLARMRQPEVVREELADVRTEDLAEGLTRLGVEDGLALLNQLDDEAAANVLVELPTETTRQFVQELSDVTLALYLDLLPMDDAIDLREELGPERFDRLLEVIPREDASEIRRLLAYPEDSVGRLMTERFFEVTPETTMAELLADIRRASDEKYETVNDIYVIDEDRHLAGVFSLRRAIRAQPGETARELMRDEVITVKAVDDAEEAARRMSRYGFYALPVLDSRGRMVGLFTGDDAQTILREAETEDILKLGAVSGDAEAYLSLSPLKLAGRRLPWLIVLFVAETLTGFVLRHYLGGTSDGDTSQVAVIAQLMLFVPLLIGAGGNSGSQVTTTITRALAVGEVKPGDVFLVFRREILVALLVGASLGLLGFLRALIGWGSGIDISLVVGLALPLIVVWATMVGSLLPLAAKRLGIDPAVMSAPFITTFVDATGLIIYFEIAKIFLGPIFQA